VAGRLSLEALHPCWPVPTALLDGGDDGEARQTDAPLGSAVAPARPLLLPAIWPGRPPGATPGVPLGWPALPRAQRSMSAGGRPEGDPRRSVALAMAVGVGVQPWCPGSSVGSGAGGRGACARRRSGWASLTARRSARRVRGRTLAAGVHRARCANRLARASEANASEAKASAMALAPACGAERSLQATMVRTGWCGGRRRAARGREDASARGARAFLRGSKSGVG
jgi:hypothetical protein